MESISPKLSQEIERRMANGGYHSVDELISVAFKAMDDLNAASRDQFEKELMKGLEGDDVTLNRADLDNIRQQALRELAAEAGE